jgi:hypothetical protein
MMHESSILAEKTVDKASHYELILKAMQRTGFAIPEDLIPLTGLTYHQICRRTKEMIDAGKLKETDLAKKNMNGNLCRVLSLPNVSIKLSPVYQNVA